jgi:TRAP-type C4-dicarboxylate transport system permease small subunit
MGRLLALLNVLLVVIVLIGTASRYTGKAIFGTDEIAILLAMWIYFLGMSIATAKDNHIEGGILSALSLSDAARRRLGLARTLIALSVLMVFCYHATNYFVELWESGRSSTYYRLPSTLWAASFIFGIAFSIIALAGQLVRQLRGDAPQAWEQ